MGSEPLSKLQFLNGSRPILLQKARQRAISEDVSPGLTSRAVIRLVAGINETLYCRLTRFARFSKSSVHIHLLAESRHFLREVVLWLHP